MMVQIGILSEHFRVGIISDKVFLSVSFLYGINTIYSTL